MAMKIPEAFENMTNLMDKMALASRSATWDDAEVAFPESSVCWDRDGGPAWVGDGEPLIIITGSSLSVGYGVHAPFKWALWHAKLKRWMFM